MIEEAYVREKKSLLPDANKIFDRVSSSKTNARVMDQMSKRVVVRAMVISCLRRINERKVEINWWQDTDLMDVFKHMYKADVLPLPIDPVERIRWIAFLCIRICEVDDFNYGSLLLPLDYLPDDQLDSLINSEYTKSIGAVVKKLRRDLKDMGWDKVFGW